MKRLCFILCCIMVLNLFISCKGPGNGTEKSTSPENYERATNVYKYEKWNIPAGYIYENNNVILYGGRIHVLCRKGIEYSYIIYSADTDGQNEKTIHIENNNSDRIYCLNILPDSSYVILSGKILYKLGDDGAKEFVSDVSNAVSDDTYFEKMLATSDVIYITSMQTIYAFSSSGEFLYKFKDNKDIFDIAEHENSVYIKYSAQNEYTHKITGGNTEKIENAAVPQNITAIAGYYETHYGTGYDKYYRNHYGVYGWNEGDEEAAILLDWQNSDIYERAVTILSVISPDMLLCSMRDYFDAKKQDITILTRIPDDEVTPKIPIILALTLDNASILVAAAYFNMTNDKYRVIIDDYYKYNEVYNQRRGVEIFNLDIVAGKIPDMMTVDYNMPVDSYISKGLFYDVSEYRNADNGIGNIMDFVYNAYNTYDKLYTVPINFELTTLVGKKSVIGNKASMTIDEMFELINTLPDSSQLFLNLDKNFLRSNVISSALDYFVDFEKNTCNFQTGDFYRIFEYIKNMPDTYGMSEKVYFRYDHLYLSSNTWYGGEIILPEDYQYILDSGIPCLIDIVISSPEVLIILKHILGNDYILKGYPAKHGNGSMIYSNMILAVTEASAAKDGAVEFINFMLSDKMQITVNELMTGLPVTLSGLKALLSKETYYHIPYNPPVDGRNRITYPIYNNLYIFDNYLNYYKEYTITQKDIDNFIDCLNNMELKPHNDRSDIHNIIREELDIYYNGGVTIQKAAEYIQNRVNTYLSE